MLIIRITIVNDNTSSITSETVHVNDSSYAANIQQLFEKLGRETSSEIDPYYYDDSEL